MDTHGFDTATDVRALEIGSWDGTSSFFTLNTLPNARLTSVDTWEGADEHKSGVAATHEVLSAIEAHFDANLSRHGDRLAKYKGTSFAYIADNPATHVFDLIYVDGSHHADDVIVDAINCFGMLKVGGGMIFDDDPWTSYPRERDNPATTLNAFLRLKQGAYKIVRLYS